jgi:DNA-binding NtrC family response regulator
MAESLFDQRYASSQPTTSYQLDAAFQEQDGIDRVQQAMRAGTPYDVAFVDARMPPGSNGIQTIFQLRQRDPALQVVLCTPDSDVRWDEVMEALGTTRKVHLLRKPLSVDHVRRMAEVLGTKAQRDRMAGPAVENLLAS